MVKIWTGRRLDLGVLSFLTVLGGLFSPFHPSEVQAPVLLVASAAENSVSLYDPATLQLATTLPTGPGPHEIAVTANGAEAYVANTGTPDEPGNTVTVIDLVAHTVARTLTLPSPCHPHDLRPDRDGERLWVTCATARRVAEVSASTGELIRWWPTDVEGGWMLASAPDDERVFVANLEGGSVSVIDRSRATVETLPLTVGQIGIDVAPDGGEVWSASAQSEQIVVIDATTGSVRATLAGVVPYPGRVRFTSDGEHVLVVYGGVDPGLAIFRARDYELEARISLPSAGKCITVSRDGSRAYITHPAANYVTAVDLADRRVVAQIPTGQQPDGVRLSDGR